MNYFTLYDYNLISAELSDMNAELGSLFSQVCGEQLTDKNGAKYYAITQDAWDAFIVSAEDLVEGFGDYCSTIGFSDFTPYLSTHGYDGY